MRLYYYIKNAQANGPEELSALKTRVVRGELPPDVKVCPVGGTEWIKLSDVPEASAAEDVPMFDAKPASASKGTKEYKVLSQKDKWFSGKFDPERLEVALNSYAQQGWRVVSCASADINSILGGARQEMVIIMERDVQ